VGTAIVNEIKGMSRVVAVLITEEAGETEVIVGTIVAGNKLRLIEI